MPPLEIAAALRRFVCVFNNVSNSAQQLMHEAALLLDESEDVEGAERALREAINLAVVAGRAVELIQAKTFLGELLLNTNRADEAFLLFEEVIASVEDPSIEPGAVAVEVEIARGHIAAGRH